MQTQLQKLQLDLSMYIFYVTGWYHIFAQVHKCSGQKKWRNSSLPSPDTKTGQEFRAAAPVPDVESITMTWTHPRI